MIRTIQHFSQSQYYVANIRCTAILMFPTHYYLLLFLLTLSLPLGDWSWVPFASLLLSSMLERCASAARLGLQASEILPLWWYYCCKFCPCVFPRWVMVIKFSSDIQESLQYPLHLVSSMFLQYPPLSCEISNLCFANQKLFQEY